jgi:quercetin dioxygenase-like cupin family protein/predicted ester cyclase
MICTRLPPVVFVLSVVSAVVLFGMAASVDDGPVGISPAGEGKEIVGDFYDAVNAAIATGDTTTLAKVVAPEFVEHEPVPGLTPDRAGLERYVAALHADFPQLKLTAETVIAEGDLVMARTSARGVESAAFLAIPLTDRFPSWGRVDRFRVAGGMIVERWAGGGELSLLEPFYRGWLVDQEELSTQQRVVSVSRVTHVLGGSRRWQDLLGQSLLVVETGRLSVVVDASSPSPALLAAVMDGGTMHLPEPLAPGTELTLGPGQGLIVPSGAVVTTRNDERAPAVILVVAMTTPVSRSDARTSPRATPTDVAGELLAGESLTSAPSDLATVAIGRATLAPGGALPRHQAVGPELVAVESGSLALETNGERTWVYRGVDGYKTVASTASLTAGDGALVNAGTTVSYRNDGDTPLLLLVVTMALPES